MSFTEMVNELDHMSAVTESTTDKIIAFVEAGYAELKTNISAAELKVIEESGTEDDLKILIEAAEEGFIVRAKKSIEKIIETIKKYIKEAKEKIKEFFEKKETDEKLSKIQQIIQNNPKLKNEKVKIVDTKRVKAVIDKYESDVRTKLAKLKPTKTTEKDVEDIKERRVQFVKDHKAAVAATVTVTVAAAVGVVIALVHEAKGVECDIKINDFNPDSTAEHVKGVVEGTEGISFASKLRMDSITDAIKGIFGTIKAKCSGGGVVDIDKMHPGKQFKESTDEVVEETVGDDIDQMLQDIIESVESELLSEDDDDAGVTTESTEEITAEAYLESLEAELFGEDEEEVTVESFLESLENELFGEEITESEDDVEDVTEREDDEAEMVTAEAYLESLEAELFGEDEEEVTVESVLEKLEEEIFG